LTTHIVLWYILTSSTIRAVKGVVMLEDMKQIIASRLLELRGRTPREEVAKALGISVSALQMYENAQRIPRDEIKLKIAAYYGKTVQEIFFDGIPHEMCGSGHETEHHVATA